MPGTVIFPGGFTPKVALDGTERVPIDGARESATVDQIAGFGLRVITSDATLTASDRIVIIDSADPTISLTLDADSATRGRCEILWAGEPSDPRTLTLVRAGGTGTIDGVSASKVVTGRAKLAVYATGAGEWFTDAGETTQTVTSSPATVSAKVVVLDDDGHTAMSPGTLVMPPITPGAVHLIVTPYENVHYLVTKAPGDPVNTGPGLVVDSSYVRQQTIVLVAVERDGILRWHYDSTGYYVTQILSLVLSQASQLLALERPYADARTHEENGAAYTWSDGSAVKRLVINRTGSQCAVTLDESDWEDGETGRLDCYNTDNLGVQIIVGGGAVLNGRTAGVGYATLPGSDLVGGMPPCFEVTRIDGGWTIRPMVDFGPRLDDVESVLGTLSGTTVPALDTRIDALEAIATTPVSSTTGTTLSWEAQERVRVANTGTTHCLVTLNGDTTEWPVGRARAISQYGSTTGGFTIAVPSGHKLNTVTNGTSGVIGTSAAAAGTALYTVMVTREASDEWSWA